MHSLSAAPAAGFTYFTRIPGSAKTQGARAVAAVAIPRLPWYDAHMTGALGLLTTAKDGFTTISPDRDTVASFDREGRLYSYFKSGVTYRRTLASVVEVRYREESRKRERLSPAGAHRPSSQKLTPSQPPVTRTLPPKSRLASATRSSLDARRLLAQGEEFARIYKPITILPPDQYLSIVLQATEGCTWNRCTFCSFYQDRPFRAKSEPEFADHVEAVKAFFGKGASMRKGIFLADGNALALSQSRLEPLFHLARKAFPGQPIYSFIDLYTGERRRVEDWRRLGRAGAAAGVHRDGDRRRRAARLLEQAWVPRTSSSNLCTTSNRREWQSVSSSW